MNKVSYLFAGICCLLSLSLNAQQLDVLLGSSIDCGANSFCVSIQLQSTSSVDIGTSSIFLDYNENALSFNSYTSTSFDGSAQCVANVASAWDVHSFDGISVPGDFNLTMTLLLNDFSCPSVTNAPVEAGIICFDILDGKADPMVSVNLENTQFNSAATNDGSSTIEPSTGAGITGAALDCTIPCIAKGGDSDGDGVCNADDQCPTFDDNLLGQPCDDGDACTVGDVYSNCGCTPGAFQDADNDGICNANDLCAGSEPGMACDDNNACTTDDTVDNNCNCVGISQDSDNDNVCDSDDQCPGFDDNLLGLPCDDGDACTVGDVYSNCGCTPGTTQDSDNDGLCDVLDKCPNDAANGCTPSICVSAGRITSHEHIQKVVLNTIDNTSNKEGYGDFLSINTDLQKGQAYPITLTPSSTATYNQFWNVWIDFNQDGDFDDVGERVLSEIGVGAVQGSISVPTTNIFNGSTVMRVTMQWEVEPLSCGEICYGEVEDYSISIF